MIFFLKKRLFKYVEKAAALGLPSQDVESAKEFINYGEFALCFDTVIVQLYEYDIMIDNEFYAETQFIGKKLNFPEEEYSILNRNI